MYPKRSRLMRGLAAAILLTSLAVSAVFIQPEATAFALPIDGVVTVPPGGSVEIAAAFDPSFEGVEDISHAIDMALDDYGDIQGFSLARNDYDAGCTDEADGAAAGTTIVAHMENTGVVGPICSASTRGMLPLLETAHVPMISYSATSAGLYTYGPTMFNRVVLTDAFLDAWDLRISALSSVNSWEARFFATYGHAPIMFAKYAYDATHLLLSKIDAVAVVNASDNLVIDRLLLAAAVRSTSGSTGVTGDITLNPYGDRIDTLVPWSDHFNSPDLRTEWSWVREDPALWSLTEAPGFMRLYANPGGIPDGDAMNLLVQQAPAGDYTLRTRMSFNPTENYQIAGLLMYQDDDNYLLFGRAFCDAVHCVGNGIYFDYAKNGEISGSNFAVTTTVPVTSTYLKVVKEGDFFTASVSGDGMTWSLVGTHTATIKPVYVGLAAIQGASLPADFDFFLIQGLTNRLFLPVVTR